MEMNKRFNLPVPNWEQIPEMLECEISGDLEDIDVLDGFAHQRFPVLENLKLTKVSLKAGKVTLNYTQEERRSILRTVSTSSNPQDLEPQCSEERLPLSFEQKQPSRFILKDLIDGIPDSLCRERVAIMERSQCPSRFMKSNLPHIDEIQSNDVIVFSDPTTYSSKTPEWLVVGRKIAMFDQRMAKATQHIFSSPEIWGYLRSVAQKLIPNLPEFTPAFKQSIINLHAYYVLDSNLSTAFYLNLSFLKSRMHTDEILIFDFFHTLYSLSSYFLSLYSYYKKRYAGEKCQAKDFGLQQDANGDLDHSKILSLMDTLSKFFVPTSNLSLLTLLSARFRLLSQMKNIAMDFMGILAWLIRWVIDFYRDNFYGMTEGVEAWMKKVDEIEEVFTKQDGQTTTMRCELTKNEVSRLQVLSLLSQGRQLTRRFEKSDMKKNLLKPLQDRVRKLERIVSGNTASFVGCEGKVKPYTFYIYGAPGCGKTVMLPHLAYDICTVLEEPEFDKSRDIYAVMSNTPYHDQYAYQRFAICNDVFQMKDSDYRNTEIFNLIQMTDESPYPLNIAECTGKGTIYFSSPFVMLTSNFDLMEQMPELESRMVDPQALKRRINIFIQVSSNFDPNNPRFQRDAMHFEVTMQNGTTYSVGWWGLIKILRDDIKKNFFLSDGVNDLTRLQNEEDMLKALIQKDKSSLDDKTLEDPQPGPSKPPVEEIVEEEYFDDPMAFCSGDKLPNNPEEFDERLGEMEVVQAFSFKDYLPSFDDIKHLVSPLPEPPLLVRVAGGHYWPHYVVSSDAQLYCEMHRRQTTAMKILKVMGSIALGFGVWKLLHKVLATLAPWETSQMAVTTSGGAYEVRPTKQKQTRKPQFRRVDFCESKDYFGWNSSNGWRVQSMVSKNMCVVRHEQRQINGIFIFGHVLMVPQHIFQDIETDTLSVLLPNHIAHAVDMSELQDDEVIISEKRHLVFMNLKRALRNYAQFNDLRQYFLQYKKDDDYQCKHGYMTVIRPDSIQGGAMYQLALSDIKPDLNEALIYDEKYNTKYKVVRTLRATVSSTTGDCGSVWVMDRGENGGAKIAGVHISGDRALGLGRAAIVTRTMIDEVADTFGYGKPKTFVTNPEEQNLFETWHDAIDQVEAIDVLGTSDVQHHQSSRSELTKSAWFGIREPLTLPAQLKKFKTEDGQIVLPQQVNAKRYKGERRGIPIDEINQALTYFADWYPRPSKNERRVLTIEQAIFGEQDGWNTSIKMDTSLGYPWNQTYKKRKQLFTLEPQWISDELRQACKKLLEGEIEDVLILDNLKDERISVKKAKSGDTRVFMILPFHVNIVLKQLFGDFVIYLQKRWPIAPVKIGISPLPQDWTKLYDYLSDNGGDLVAGDYSAWDKKVHYEIMLSLVDWVNEWYDDEFSEIRRQICQKVFQCEHLICGTIYRTNCGMPSGCYLTTPFNSLANLLYWYIFILTKVPESKMSTHTWWFRPAVYGDDHVMSIRGHPNINAQTFADWITDKGLKYTDAYKERPVTPYEPWSRVQFLKRTFEKRGGYVWAPLKKDQLYDMVQWYRSTPATRSLNLIQLSEQILEAVLNEAFLHGRQVFEEIRDELLAYFEQKTNRSLTHMPLSYKFYWDRFMIEGDKPTMWTHFTTWNTKPMLIETIQAKDDAVDPAQISIPAVEKSADTTVIDNQGLEQPTPAPVPNEQMVADTLISDPQAPQEDSALSQFRDAQRRDTLTIGSSVTPVVDMNFVFPQGYFDLAERSFPIASMKLTSVEPNAYPLRRFDILNAILQRDQIQQKLSNAQYVRFNMEVQIRILATNFHYGQILAVFRPAYFPFLKVKITENPGDRLITTLKPNWAPYGPYDHVYTASQLPHSVISVTAGNSVTIQCPWSLNFQYVPVSQVNAPRYHFGFIDIYNLTPILPAEADPPTLQIFGRLKDIQGFGYQFAGSCGNLPPSAMIKINKYVKESGGETWTQAIPYDVPTNGVLYPDIDIWRLGKLSDITNELKVTARWNGADKKTITMIEQVSQDGGAKVLTWDDLQKREKKHEKQRREKTQAGELEDIYTTNEPSSSRGTFATLAEFIGDGLQRLGLSKPLLSQPPSRVINVAPPIANSVGEDFTISTAYHAKNMVMKNKNQHSEKIIIQKLAAIPMFLGSCKFDARHRTLELKLAPHSIIKDHNLTSYMMTPAGYIASRFAFWRGSLHYWFHFSSSSFINARFQLMAAYRNISVAPGYVPTQYIEVKGDAVAEGKVPFLWETQWAEFGNESMEWYLSLQLQENTPVAWKKDETTPLMCTIWVAFEDFQVAQPAINVFAGIPWGYGYYFEGNHPVSYEGMKRYSKHAPFHKMVSTKALPPPEEIPPAKPPKYEGVQSGESDRALLHHRMILDYENRTGRAVIEEVIQAGEVPGAITVSKSFAVGTNDIPTSLYHIMKRNQTARATLLVPFAPMILVSDTSTFKGNYVNTFNGNVTWPAALFRWISSSVNTVSDAFNSVMDVPLMGSAYEQYVHDATLFKNEAVNSLMGQFHPVVKRFSERLIAVRQPYRSNLPFVSGPHVYQTFDESEGYTGMHFLPMQGGLFPREIIQGMWFHYDKEDPDHASFTWSFADDLCLNLFMGVPCLVNFENASLAGSLYGPNTL